MNDIYIYIYIYIFNYYRRHTDLLSKLYGSNILQWQEGRDQVRPSSIPIDRGKRIGTPMPTAGIVGTRIGIKG